MNINSLFCINILIILYIILFINKNLEYLLINCLTSIPACFIMNHVSTMVAEVGRVNSRKRKYSLNLNSSILKDFMTRDEKQDWALSPVGRP